MILESVQSCQIACNSIKFFNLDGSEPLDRNKYINSDAPSVGLGHIFPGAGTVYIPSASKSNNRTLPLQPAQIQSTLQDELCKYHPVG